MRTITGEALKILHPYTFEATVLDPFRGLYLGRDKGDQSLIISLEGHKRLNLPTEIVTSIADAAPILPSCPGI